MRRTVRLLAGLLCLALAGCICYQGREGWPWFLGVGAGFVYLAGRE